MRPVRVEGEVPKQGDRVVINNDRVGKVERVFQLGDRRFVQVKFDETTIETIELTE